MEQDLELVLFRRQQLLFIRREHHLLFQGESHRVVSYRRLRAVETDTHSLDGPFPNSTSSLSMPTFCRSLRITGSSALCSTCSVSGDIEHGRIRGLGLNVKYHYRVHGLCHELTEAIFEATVRSVLLGTYDALVDCRLEVGHVGLECDRIDGR